MQNPLMTPQLPSLQRLQYRAISRWFYPVMAAVALAFSLVAFAPAMLSPAGRRGPLSFLLAVHGVVFLAWLLLFLAQSLLAASRELVLHRILGTGSVGLAAAMIVLVYSVTIEMARRGYDLSGDLAAQRDPLAAIGFPLFDTLLFAILFSAAYIYRRRSAIHKRLMLLATFAALMPAPVAHLTGHYAALHGKIPFTPVFVGGFLFTGAAYDLVTTRRVHPVFLWIPLVIFAVENICFAKVFPSPAWHHIAAWLIR